MLVYAYLRATLDACTVLFSYMAIYEQWVDFMCAISRRCIYTRNKETRGYGGARVYVFVRITVIGVASSYIIIVIRKATML